MKISVFSGGYQNVTPDDLIEDWEDLVNLLMCPVEGQKNGAYYVRGECKAPRNDDNMQGIDIIVIDGDSTMTNGASCVPPQPVHEAMVAENITHVIHTSYSNDLLNSKHKWRMVIPCDDLVDSATLAQGVREIIAILHNHGLPVRCVKEDLALSQPWFTPRCPVGMDEDFWCNFHDGRKYTLTGESITVNLTEIVPESRKDEGIFSWELAAETLRGGSIHQALLSACGWLTLTTDWADVQIKQMLTEFVKMCPDKKKLDRALNTKEIDNVIKHCREKAGTAVEIAADWREFHVTAADLQNKEFPPVKWAVDELIPEGFIILAGDPKVGKSLLAVDICSAIASGGHAFGSQKCVSGSAVYVSLEDPQRRVKDRIMRQVDLWPETFHVVTGGVGKLDIDFYKMLDQWAMLWSDLRCIVVDTMSFIMPEKKHGASDYDHTYTHLDPVHRWAIDNHVAVILITHKRKGAKGDGENPFDGIIGSTAISGCADAMLLLSRNHAKAQDPTNLALADGFLDVAGREISSAKYSLDFDTEAIKWALRGEIKPEDVTGNSNWLLISDVLKNNRMMPKEIGEQVGLNTNTVKSALSRMKKQKIVDNVKDVGWGLVGVEYGAVVSSWG